MTKRKIVSYFSILLKKRPCCPTVLKGNQNVVFFLSCFLVMLSGILFSVAHWAKTAYSYSIMGPPATSWQLHNYIIMSCHILLLFYCLVGNKRLLTDLLTYWGHKPHTAEYGPHGSQYWNYSSHCIHSEIKNPMTFNILIHLTMYGWLQLFLSINSRKIENNTDFWTYF